MAERCGADASRFKLDVLSQPPPPARPRAGRRELDSLRPSSWSITAPAFCAIVVCAPVMMCMENHVIGRTGKGATAGIGFDLNDPMGESTCVQCGECMVSCPTSAITFKPVAQVKFSRSGRSAKFLTCARTDFRSGLRGNSAKVSALAAGPGDSSHDFSAGQVLCRQGDPGNTAFIIRRATARNHLSRRRTIWK